MALGDKEVAVTLKLISDQFNSQMRRAGTSVQKITAAFNKWKFVILGAGVALGALVKRTANYGDMLAKTSKKIGVSTEALSGLKFAGDISGISFDKMRVGLQQLAKNMLDAANDTGEAKDAFLALGFSTVGVSGNLKGTEQTLLELADKFAEFEDGPNKAALAMRIFGKSGVDLIPLLNEGAAGIEKLKERARELGIVMSAEDAAAAEKFNDSLTELSAAVSGLGLQLGNALIPALTDLINMFTNLVTLGGKLGGIVNFIRFTAINLVGALEKLIARGVGLTRIFIRLAEAKPFTTLLADLRLINREVAEQIRLSEESTEAALIGLHAPPSSALFAVPKALSGLKQAHLGSI